MEVGGCGGAVGSPEAGGAGIALVFPAGEASAARVPRRIRRRLLESRSHSAPSSLEEIEAKLKEADLRRQQFYEWLSSKARPRPKSPSWSSQEEDLGQRLEAKLYAAEQKRLSLLAKAQMRLARLDEIRQAAKSGVEMRFEKEREELGTKVESRVQQAEANRTRLMKAHMQKRAATQERTARSLLERIIRETKYKECVRSAILQKRAAAEKKRMGLLEAEKKRAHARVMQAHRVAKTVCHQRESERRRMKEQLENRLQKAKRQRAELLRQRCSPQSSRINLTRHGEFLSRKLARCWRWFVTSRKTTFALAKSYEALGIAENIVKSMPFEQLATRIESATTLQTVKPLLDRLESRFLLSQASHSSAPENINHLLKRLSSPNKKTPSRKATRTRTITKKALLTEPRSSEVTKLSRYSVRVVLCAYMILGHPNAVFSGWGEREAALSESAANFVREFELLIKIILDGPNRGRSLRQPSADIMSDDLLLQQESSAQWPRPMTFRSQMAAFDTAWRSYLYCFVVWKVKDARSLEEDLVRAACLLELSMMQTCKLTSEGQPSDLTHDMRAIQKQVTEDQKLLREKVLHLSGGAGIERMESALSDTRSKFFEAKESRSPSVAHAPHISSSSTSKFAMPPLISVSEDGSPKSSLVVRSLFGNTSSSTAAGKEFGSLGAQSNTVESKLLPTDNELLVNEILHGGQHAFASNDDRNNVGHNNLKAKVKDTMEKAFWDGIMDSLKEDVPDFSRVVGLVKEVRDELCEMAPQSWKQEVLESIDLDILSQVLEAGIQDTDYLGRILEYALGMLQKLSAPANEDKMRKEHQKLLSELSSIAQPDDRQNSSFIIATIRGLRFVLAQILTLKSEISKARIQMMEPIIKGPAGLEYLQKAFADRYGPPSDAGYSLPLTVQWISSVKSSLEEEWNEHVDSLSNLSESHVLPHVTALRTCGSIPLASKDSSVESHPISNASGSDEQPECNRERVDILVRLGILKLASGVKGLTVETLPETLKLNCLRLRSVQGLLQQIIVISTSVLVLWQILRSEGPVNTPELENTVSDSIRRLLDLLDVVPDVGIEGIIETIIGFSEANSSGRREVMTRMLTKSLQNDDPVFTRVSRSIYLAARGVVLGGSGARGRKLAEVALRCVGATMLLDRVVKAADVLIVVASLSGRVHGPWYRLLV